MNLDLVGQIIGQRYRIEEQLGEGAMGAVFRARHVKVGRLFAVKLLHPRLLDDEKVRLRFDREAEIAGTLRHPNLIGVVDAGETPEGLRYLVMEHAEGETLSTLIEQAPLPAPRVLRLVQQLCDGLAHAHGRGLIHRDFKPDNVIVANVEGVEVPRIVDFGIAILRDDVCSSGKKRLTTTGLVLGTPHYMAPEQAFGVKWDHRIDLFALGVICYEMLTGQMPFEGDGVDVVRANIGRPTPPMGVRAPFADVDPLLEAFTLKLMMKKPEDRFATALEARHVIDLIKRDPPAAAIALGVDPRLVESMRAARTMPTQESAPQLAPPAAIANSSDQVPVLAKPEPETRAPTTALTAISLPAEVTKPRSQHRFVIGLAAGFAALVAIVVGAGRSNEDRSAPQPLAQLELPRSPPRAHPLTATMAASAPVMATAPATTNTTPMMNTVATPATTPAAPATVPVRAQSKVTKPLAKPMAGSEPPHPQALEATKLDPVAKATEPDTKTEPSAKAVADLYVAIGRELRAAGDRDAIAATPLWSRYRLIKINDAMATLVTQRAALRELASIRGAIKH